METFQENMGLSVFGVEPEFIEVLNSIPESIRKIEGINDIDPFAFRKKFLSSNDNVADNSVDPNANMDAKSPVSLTAEMFKPLQKIDSLHTLWYHIKDKYGSDAADRAIQQMVNGRLYFHDSTKTHIPYCVAASSYSILLDGLFFGANPRPPKRSDSYTNQTIELIMQMAQEVAGAVAIPDYFVNYSWFSKREGKSDYAIKQDQERFVFTVNNSFRVGGDSPFTNLPIFDKTTFDRLFGEQVFPDGTRVADYWDEVERVQDIFCSWFSEGNGGVPFKFPVVTLNIATDENGDIIHENHLEKMMSYNKKLCCFNIYVGEKLASCCRLTSDLKAMKENIRFNSGFGNGGLNIGSHRVVAINLHRIALEATYDNGLSFFDRLGDAMDLSAEILDVHRNSILKRRISQNFLRFFTHKWLDLDMFFSTIGLVGLSDAVRLMSGHKTSEPEGHEYATRLLTFMENRAKEYTSQYDGVFNIEECPAEGSAAKLAKKDAVLYGTRAEDCGYIMPVLLANQTVPPEEDLSLFDRANKMGPLMQMSGGSIAHFNIVDEDPDPHSLMLFTKRLVYDHRVPHFAFNKGFSICASGHITHAIVDKCSQCGDPIVDRVTRIVGYFVHESKWNKPRRDALRERKFSVLNGVPN
jgi:ribonucleoside-triphosphate reductase